MRNKKTEVAPHGSQLGLANSEVTSPIPKLKGRQDSTAVLFECVISMETLINDVLNNHANISLKSQETTNLRHYLRSCSPNLLIICQESFNRLRCDATILKLPKSE